MSDIDSVRALQLIQQRNRNCLNSAVLDGLTSAGISLAVAGGLSWSLQQSSDVRNCGEELWECVGVGVGVGKSGKGHDAGHYCVNRYSKQLLCC